MHRIYRGKLDRPKSERSKRTVALSLTTQNLMTQWRQQSGSCDPDAWVFPSAKLTTPIGRDNAWRGLLAPRLKTIQLEWATFQIMRRTHASLSRQAGIDPLDGGPALRVRLVVQDVQPIDREPAGHARRVRRHRGSVEG